MLIDKLKILKWFAHIAVIFFLSGCGGDFTSHYDMEQNDTEQNITIQMDGNNSDNNLTDITQNQISINSNEGEDEIVIPDEPQEIYHLTFIDSPVVNLTYECGDKIARTDSEGNLSCALFPIIFSAIGIEIGELERITDDHKVYPQDLVGVSRKNTSDKEVKKIASFLQSLDDDGDVSRYIIIQDRNTTQFKQQKETIQKRNIRRLADMSSSDMFALLRSRGYTPISLYKAEQNLRRYGLGLVPILNYTPPPTPPDVTPPVVTLNGDANISLYIDQKYIELNATATDDRDGNVSASITIIGSVDTSTVGVYILVYKATDNAGNEGNTTRIVNVLPTRKTGQTVSYDANGNAVTNGTLKDDGYYQKGVDANFTRDDAKEIVIDNLTGLVWQDNRSVALLTKQWLTDDNYNTCHNDTTSPACLDTSGDTATTYCANLTLGGYNDWRLPTEKELEQLLNYGLHNPTLDSVFQNVNSNNYYWSSSTLESYGDYAWFVYFRSGEEYSESKDKRFYIRCVRDGQ